MSTTRFMSTIKSICSLNRRREFEDLLRRVAPTKNDSLLDIGCGDGYWTNRFADYAGRTIGLDPDPAALQSARKLHGAKVVFQQGLAEELPFADNSFDCIVSVSCFEHFRDAQQALHECFRVLKPGGRLAISVDSLLPQNSSAGFRSWHSQKYFVTEYFTEQRLAAMFEQAGFRCSKQPATHILNSRRSAHVRDLFLRHPRRWLPAFPLLYAIVLYFDRREPDMPGQVLVATAFKPGISDDESLPKCSRHSHSMASSAIPSAAAID